MNALVVYESMYGNTRELAEAVADALGGAAVQSVHEAQAPAQGVELLVVGGPTHMHGMTTKLSRRMAAEAAGEDGAHLEPGATEEPGLRQWLRDLPKVDGIAAAAFDTRGDASPTLTGAAARGIARRLRGRGYDVLGRESFLVAESEGPLAEGELDRARAWGKQLADELSRR